MSIGSPPSYVADDLLQMPDGKDFELVDGQLVERRMGAESSWVAGQVHSRIDAFARQHRLGWAFPEGTSFQCFSDDRERVRRPDAAFVRRERLTRLPTGHCRVTPDLAVEVVSPHDTYYEVDEKIQEFLEAGVPLIWLINPQSRLVQVHSSDSDSIAQLTDGDELTGGQVLPGFTLAVAEILPPREAEPSER